MRPLMNTGINWCPPLGSGGFSGGHTVHENTDPHSKPTARTALAREVFSKKSSRDSGASHRVPAALRDRATGAHNKPAPRKARERLGHAEMEMGAPQRVRRIWPCTAWRKPSAAAWWLGGSHFMSAGVRPSDCLVRM